MKILITGGTGFIGSALCKIFSEMKYNIYILTRKISDNLPSTSTIKYITALDDLSIAYDVIINLAGQPLNKARWNDLVKKDIYNSRINTTQKIINYIKAVSVKPKLLISASAIGYYSDSLDQIFTEQSAATNLDFAHKLCQDWEDLALQAENFAVRVCIIRTGIVLGKHGGALREMLLPFKLGLGAQIGNGAQWMSWIHINDHIAIIKFLINNSELSGVFNLTAPNPVTNRVFSKSLARCLHRPCFLKLPNFMVKILFGEMGETLLLKGQRVMPNNIIKAGYTFEFPKIEQAFLDILA